MTYYGKLSLITSDSETVESSWLVNNMISHLEVRTDTKINKVKGNHRITD